MTETVVTQDNTNGGAVTQTETTLVNTEEKKTEGTDNKVDATKVETPVEYTDFKLPDGVEVDKETLAAFKTEAKGLKLTQEQAQKLIDMQTGLAQKQSKVANEMWANVQKDWVDKAKSDKEFGGDKFNENLVLAKRAMEKFATPEFKTAMDLTGMGNHPELIRFLVRVGQHFKEDKVMTAGNPAGSGVKDPAKILYPNMN